MLRFQSSPTDREKLCKKRSHQLFTHPFANETPSFFKYLQVNGEGKSLMIDTSLQTTSRVQESQFHPAPQRHSIKKKVFVLNI